MNTKSLFIPIIILLTWGSHNFANGVPLVNAGILPYMYDTNGNAYFLIGREPSGVWADFGGRFEKDDRDNITTAAREFSEETRYVFGKFAKDVEKLEEKFRGKYYLGKSIEYIKPRITAELTHPKGYYKMYLAQVDFIPADVFNNAGKVAHYEKREYAWVPVGQFMEAVHSGKDRWDTFYRNKKIRRHFFDVLKPAYNTIMQIIYPQPISATQQEPAPEQIIEQEESW